MRRFLLSISFTIAFFAIHFQANAATYYLNSDNNFSVEIEPGVTISQSGSGNGGPVTIFGGEFALGDSASANFTGITNIGGRSPNKLDPRPLDLVRAATPFSILATDTGNVYDALLLYFQGFSQSAGQLPMDAPTGTNITLAFDANLPQPVPLPAAAYLMISALAGLGFIGRRRKGQK